MTYVPPTPVTPTFGGTITVPIYDAPYTLPVSVSHGGPVFCSNTLSPVVTWDTSGYWARAFSNNPTQTSVVTNVYFNCIMLFPDTYTGSSNNLLVNNGNTGAYTNFTCSNGGIYGIADYYYDAAYYYQGTLLTPYYDGNATGMYQNYLGIVTGLWRPTAGTNEHPKGTFTAISPAQSETDPIKIFQLAWQFSGTVGENCIYIAGTQVFNPQGAVVASNMILSQGPSSSLPNNPSQTSAIFGGSPPESTVAIWYNQTEANGFRGGKLPVSGMPNVIMNTYVDNTTLACYHLYGYNPAASYDAVTGQYVPEVTDIGAFLVPGITSGDSSARAPDALCGFGFFWQTSPHTGIVLTPEGTAYYDLTFVGETTNAKAALASGYTTIMGDGYGVFWVVTYTLSSSTFYVGNGQAYLLTVTNSGIVSPGYAISLPCYTPCTFANYLGG